MKRIFAILLLLVLLLTGCKQPVDTTPTGNSTAATEATQQMTEATLQTETTVKEVLYRHPLTGEPLDEPWSGQIAAVMINNLKKAMPQRGIAAADIFYEIEVEGDITRCLAVYSDLTKATVIGPVRSARTVFISVAVSYDAPLIHCGGSKTGIKGYYDFTHKLENWEHLSVDASGSDTSKIAYRDLVRYKQLGYNWEHTLFGNGKKIVSKLKKMPFSSEPRL